MMNICAEASTRWVKSVTYAVPGLMVSSSGFGEDLDAEHAADPWHVKPTAVGVYFSLGVAGHIYMKLLFSITRLSPPIYHFLRQRSFSLSATLVGPGIHAKIIPLLEVYRPIKSSGCEGA